MTNKSHKSTDPNFQKSQKPYINANQIRTTANMHHLALLQFSLLLIFVQCGSTVTNRHLQTTSHPWKTNKSTPIFSASLKDSALHHQFSQYSPPNSASTSTISTSSSSIQQQGQITRQQTRREEEKNRQMEELDALRLVKEQLLANKKKNNEARKL